MSRLVRVDYGDGDCREYPLSIATVSIEDGRLTAVEVTPFEREEAGVTYHDGPLLLRLGEAWTV